MSDGRQQRHTPDAALRIHVRVGKLVLKTQTEERASALNTSGRGSLWKSLDARCGMFLSTKTGTMIEYSLGSCRGRKKVAQVPPSRGERSNCGAERVDTHTIRACSHQKTELAKMEHSARRACARCHKEADLRSKIPARGQAFQNLSRWLESRHR